MHANRAGSTIALSLLLSIAASHLDAQAAKVKPSTCKDGSTSTAATKPCTGHGGVDSVATKAAQRTAKADKETAKAATAAAGKDPRKAAKADAKAKTAVGKADKAEDKAAKDSTGATAKCKDGTFSHTASTKGACARHGGIAKTLKSAH